MSVTNPKAAAAPGVQLFSAQTIGLIVGVAALVLILWWPTPAGLSAAGKVMLAILAFAVAV